MFFSGIADEASAPLAGQIDAHRELGWKHVEMRSVDGVNVTDLCDEVFDDVAQKLTSAALAVSCFASQLGNWSRPIIKRPDIDAQELACAIPRMQQLGCRFIRTMSYPNAGWPQQKWRDEAVARLKELASMAERGDVILVHENCEGWASQGPEQTLQLLERVGSGNLKLLWDTGNAVSHRQDTWAFYSAVRDHVVYVHVKDGVLEGDSMRYTYPAEGAGRVREVIGDLLERGYQGGFSIEPHMAAIVHEGKAASEADSAHQIYIEYGRRLMSLLDKVKQKSMARAPGGAG